MKVSDITIQDLSEYLKLDEDGSKLFLTAFLEASKNYVKSYTGMTDNEVDTHQDIVPVIYVLVADMYDNREYAQRSSRITITPNMVAKSTLDMYCNNLL